MPGFNGRGPEGKGPRSGRGLGRCRPKVEKEQAPDAVDAASEEDVESAQRSDAGPGRGFGYGRGFGRGRGQGPGRGQGGGWRRGSGQGR